MKSNREDVLKKAIEKAVENGYRPAGHEVKSVQYDGGLFVFLKEGGYAGLNPTEVIFSHEFAKAFFGETPAHQVNGKKSYWQFHLQQLVLEQDPLEYLEKYL